MAALFAPAIALARRERQAKYPVTLRPTTHKGMRTATVMIVDRLRFFLRGAGAIAAVGVATGVLVLFAKPFAH